MNYAVIFAGGTGTRMNTKTKPKQFLTLHNKEIIIYTLEHFENHPEIDGISVVCIEGWIDYLKKLIEKQERLAGLAQAAQAGYVATTVRNTAISILREKTKGKDKILSLDALGEDALRRYMIPIREEEMIRQEMARQLREGLEHMEPQERALLEGKYILAQSDKELAADFKCKPDSIRMKLTRARRKFLDIMKRSEEDD